MNIMQSKPYVIGLDFGTLSGRCILLDARDGRECAEAVLPYAHGVMDTCLPSGRALPPHYALQHPGDYIEVLRTTIPAVLQKAGVRPDDVGGIGLDFTACTTLPLDAAGHPLCLDPAFADEPLAYVLLWKHHAAQMQADRINRLAAERGEPWLSRYGGKISSEWMWPKLLSLAEEAPAVFAATARYTEAADWLSRLLTGTESHSAAFAGYKALWSEDDGYPSEDFLTALHPALSGLAGGRISPLVRGLTHPETPCAGTLNAAGAALTGLPVCTPVALPMIDAHAALPALGITSPGEMVMILGTSACHIIHAETAAQVPGICGYVRDGVVPGLYTYEAGQPCVGDGLDWFVRTGVPAAYTDEAKARGMSIHSLLSEKAARRKPGESGLIALDWLNGNRSTLNDATRSGLLLGLTLHSKPEDIYRAWIEACAFGTRRIVEQYMAAGVPVRRLTVTGGIAHKNPFMMQIYADVLGCDLEVAASTQAAARGSALYAAAAAGLYPSVKEAAGRLSSPVHHIHHPSPANRAIYDRLYTEYSTLYNAFSAEGNDVMGRLKSLTGTADASV